ncbi:MAG: integrase family protein [Magnetococcales bacterium]|nr:integrase family protein [Magnetococcales bacterium]
MRLTKLAIDRIPPPPTGQEFHFDDTMKGFGLRVTASGTKSFIVDKRIDGKKKRITIGRYGEITVEQARRQAQGLLGEIAAGGDPVREKKEEALKRKTLGEVFEDYLVARKNLTAKTVSHYRRVLTLHFSDWMERPILSITKDAIQKRHTQIGKDHGEPYANLGMRVVRALFNFAIGAYEDGQGRSLILENPVKRLSQTRAWFREERRQTLIKPHDMAAWYQGVMALENPVLRDYLLLLIFTGLRREEGAQLRWEHVDFIGKALTIPGEQDTKNPGTKNHDTHTLPLSGFLLDLLTNRRQEVGESAFVFPGGGAGGYIVEPRKQMAKVTEMSGVKFTVHDLRRTFITLAEGLDIPAYALKKLLNHRNTSDVTGGYIIIDTERLRGPMEKISAAMLSWMGVVPAAEVIPLQKEAIA